MIIKLTFEKAEQVSAYSKDQLQIEFMYNALFI